MKHNHSCTAITFSCIDWRLHPNLEEELKKDFSSFDFCSVAGSVKGLFDPSSRNYLLEQIKISKNLHNCGTIIISMHEDCGAYGGSKAFRSKEEEKSHHEKELNRAAEIVSKKFPNLKIKKYFIGLKENGNSWEVRPLLIT